MSPTRKEEHVENDVTHRYENEGFSVSHRDPDASAYDSRRRQQIVVEGLKRLHDSLRGPEDLLDRANYSRPFPPTAPRDSGRYVTGAEGRHEDPFGPARIG